MKNRILIITLLLLVLLGAYTYTMDNNFAGDEDLPRVFIIAEQNTWNLNYSKASPSSEILNSTNSTVWLVCLIKWNYEKFTQQI